MLSGRRPVDRSHAIQRAAERFGCALSTNDVLTIEGQIRHGHWPRVGVQSNGRFQFRIRIPRGPMAVAVWAPEGTGGRGAICTFLTETMAAGRNLRPVERIRIPQIGGLRIGA